MSIGAMIRISGTPASPQAAIVAVVGELAMLRMRSPRSPKMRAASVQVRRDVLRRTW